MIRTNEKAGRSFFINARFLNQPLTGVQRYSMEILKALDGLIDPGQATALCPAPLKNKPEYKNIRILAGPRMDGNLWEQFYLPWKTSGKLLYSPANIGPYLKKKQIVTIHDASVFAFPLAYTWSFRLKYRLTFRRLVRKAEHILTVSEFSRQEIQKRLKVPAERITVTYEGREHIERADEDMSILSRLGIGSKPFFIVVGSNSLHKNLKIVMQANTIIDQARYDIVLIGAENRRVFAPAARGKTENVVPAGYLKDNELKALYKKACALIFPSLYEGFGLPLLEAMACGCPLICSDIPSSREVCGSAALFFDAYTAAELAEKMELVLNKDSTVEKVRDLGKRRVKQFSWEKSARITAKLIARFLSD